MIECRICKNQSSAELCSPKCEDIFEDLSIQRNWANIKFSDASNQLADLEQGVFGPLYLRWERLQSEAAVLRKGIAALTKPVKSREPLLETSTPSDVVDQASLDLLEAKLKEHREWREEQDMLDAKDVYAGMKMLQRFERQLSTLHPQLQAIEERHRGLFEAKVSLGEKLRELSASEDLTNQRNCVNTLFSDAAEQLADLERGIFGPLYLSWERVQSETAVIREGILALLQRSESSEPRLRSALAPSSTQDDSRSVRDYKLKEHLEWREEQDRVDAKSVHFGMKLLRRIERRLSGLHEQLLEIEEQHSSLFDIKTSLEEQLKDLSRQLEG